MSQSEERSLTLLRICIYNAYAYMYLYNIIYGMKIICIEIDNKNKRNSIAIFKNELEEGIVHKLCNYF